MEVRSVLTTHNLIRADSACEELREHGIKCDTVAPTDLPDLGVDFIGSTGIAEPGIQVVVAPEDEERAKEILDAWTRSR